MKAITYKKYGSTAELQLQEVARPVPKDTEVLLKVVAVSLNSSDKEFLTANPGYVRMWGPFKPKYSILGSDVAGQVIAVGKQVKNIKVGDEVFGDIMYQWGGFAEYVCAKANALVQKPVSMTFEEVAAIPQAGVVALQALRDKGKVQAGQNVLINGAGGGAGSFAIQLAKYYGAVVTGIDHPSKLSFMRSIGADHVIDYFNEDFTKNGQQYDLIIDFVATRSLFDHKSVLKPTGQYVLVGGSVKRLLQALVIGSLISFTGKQKFGILAHEPSRKDLTFLLSLIDSGKVIPVIDKKFSLREVPEAMQYLADGKTKGKVLIRVAD